MADISLVQVVGAFTGVATFISGWVMWKAARTKEVLDSINKKILDNQESILKSTKEKNEETHQTICSAISRCDTKYSHLELAIAQLRDNIVKDSQDVRQLISEHKRETVTEIKTRQLIDDKIEPVWEVLRDLKGTMVQMATSQSDILKTLSRMEGALENSRLRRKEDN